MWSIIQSASYSETPGEVKGLPAAMTVGAGGGGCDSAAKTGTVDLCSHLKNRRTERFPTPYLYLIIINVLSSISLVFKLYSTKT